jgi:predicted dehydrogenase
MARAAQEQGIRTAVNFTYRSVTGFRLVERLLEQGQLGKLLHMDFAYFQAKDLLPGAQRRSAVQELGPHAFETVLWWSGLTGAGRVAEVLAQHAGSVPGAEQCAWHGLVRFQAGALACIQLSRIAAGYRNGFRAALFGDAGVIQMEVEVDQSQVFATRIGEGRPEGELQPVPIPDDLAMPYDRFPAFHMERLAAAAAGAAPFPGFQEALAAEELVAAMQHAERTHGWVAVGTV